MITAFRDLAEGAFARGLAKLDKDAMWHDDRSDLDGPFRLCVPDVQGWGEELLVASLLKRHAVTLGAPVSVLASWQVCCVLSQDVAFHARHCGDWETYRSPLAILRHALAGDLLDKPFVPLHTRKGLPPQQTSRRQRVGLAWASVSNNHPISKKSVPLDSLLPLVIQDIADLVSFQRKLSVADRDQLLGRVDVSVLEDALLDATSESSVDELLTEICQLDRLLTISTTTTHLAAAIGIQVDLLAAKRGSQQWYWPVQAEHQKCLYPSVTVHLGDGTKDDWWKDPLGSLQISLRNRRQAAR